MSPSANKNPLPEEHEAPPVYADSAPSYSQATQAPLADPGHEKPLPSKGKCAALPGTLPDLDELNSAFSNLNISQTALPFPDEDHCFAHLKLLNAFYNLKEDVGYTDGLFGLWNSRYEAADDREAVFARLREKRWVLFVARAAERFEIWWTNVLCVRETAQRLATKDMDRKNVLFIEFPMQGQPQVWDESMLPPLGDISHRMPSI